MNRPVRVPNYEIDQEKVDQSVEVLCASGCVKVYDFIDSLKKGRHLPEVETLNVAECQMVLAVLIDVMDTYKTCRNPNFK